MVKLSKRMSIIYSSVDCVKQYDILEGISILKKFSNVNFIESVDVAVCLGIDPKKSEQNIKGNVFLPNGIGRHVCVVVFTQGENVSLAKQAGADLVGLHDLIDYYKDKKSKKFDVVIATPDVMHIVSKLGPVLGPIGLMPNPKFGTVSNNISETVKKIKVGQIRYRNDKYGIVHSMIGKISLDASKLKENLEVLIKDLKKNRPSQSKGEYLRKIVISSTMGVGIKINHHVF